MIGIQQASLWRPQPLLRELQDFPNDAAARREGADLVAHAQRMARARGLAVDSYVVCFTRRLSQRARLEQARRKQGSDRAAPTRSTVHRLRLTDRWVARDGPSGSGWTATAAGAGAGGSTITGAGAGAVPVGVGVGRSTIGEKPRRRAAPISVLGGPDCGKGRTARVSSCGRSSASVTLRAKDEAYSARCG